MAKIVHRTLALAGTLWLGLAGVPLAQDETPPPAPPAVAAPETAPPPAAPAPEAVQSAYDFTVPGIDGTPMPLAQWRGKALLAVNTASLCGFTNQYAGLQAIWSQYRERGLVVIGVPSDDFDQELASEQEIREFCSVNFAIDFPMTARLAVTGDKADPLYAWLRERLGPDSTPRWNFHKYLIDSSGQPVAWYSSLTNPTSDTLRNAIEAALPSPEGARGRPASP